MQAIFGSPPSARRSLPVRSESARLPLSAYSMRHHVSSNRDCLAARQTLNVTRCLSNANACQVTCLDSEDCPGYHAAGIASKTLDGLPLNKVSACRLECLVTHRQVVLL